MKEGDKAKTLKAVKIILKTIKKAHGTNKVEEKPSAKKSRKCMVITRWKKNHPSRRSSKSLR